MDKKIEKKKWSRKKYLYFGIGLIGLVAIFYLIVGGESELSIDSDKVTFAVVKSGDFQEYIIQTGEVVPGRTFYLDAIEGGNIVRVFKESGSIVKKGEPILELENANLRLSVLSQENSLNEQINMVRTTRLQLDQNHLNQKQQLAQIDNQLDVLTPKYKRDSALYTKKMIADQVFEQTSADYKYNLKRKDFTSESYRNDSGLRHMQIKQLTQSEQRMLENLEGVRKILDNLVVHAPIEGTLTTVQLQEGKNVTMGERLGQVDVVGTNKVRVKIDEIYFPRVNYKCRANVMIANKKHTLKVDYIYPTIKDGSFEVDMVFENGEPQDLVNGQSLRLKIELGQASQEIQIPVGAFYSNTGGNWIFAVDPSSGKAVRRIIRLGRKNSEYYQVLEGLNPGDKVIVSSYDSFGDNEILSW